MSIAVNPLPGIQVIQIAIDGECVFLRRDQCTEFLSAFMVAMAETIPDAHSVKAPALTLVGDDEDPRDPDKTDVQIYGAGAA